MTRVSLASKLLLVGVLSFGITVAFGPGVTHATVHDAGAATGTVNAADDFGKAGPTADAGGSYTVSDGQTVTLDGSGSSTSQGTIKEYAWQITSGSGTLVDAATVTPTYEAPDNVTQDTNVTVELTITDNKGNSDTDTATITVTDSGSAGTPTIDSLTVRKTGGKNREFEIDATVSDPIGDGETLDRVRIAVSRTGKTKTVYSNEIGVSGDSASISDTTTQLQKKEYVITVTVYDTGGNSASASRTRTAG